MTAETIEREARAEPRGALRERRCIVSGEILPEGRLIRFVADPENRVTPDLAAKLPGRGLWVLAEREAITRAAAKNLFARAAQAPLIAAADLAGTVEALLVARLQGWLGLARRAGEVLLGFDSVERALRSEKPPGVLIEAAEAAEDGWRKLQAAATAKGIAPFVIGMLSSLELGLALGRGNVIHAAVKSGPIAERLIFDAGRLGGFRSLKPLVYNRFSGVVSSENDPISRVRNVMKDSDERKR